MRDDAQGGHEAGGRAPGGQARPGPSWTPRKEVGALLSPQEIQFEDKYPLKISPQSELRISGYKRNGARAEFQNAETE